MLKINHLKPSNPPNAGDPIMTATVTIMPKTTATKIILLFTTKTDSTHLKTK